MAFFRDSDENLLDLMSEVSRPVRKSQASDDAQIVNQSSSELGCLARRHQQLYKMRSLFVLWRYRYGEQVINEAL